MRPAGTVVAMPSPEPSSEPAPRRRTGRGTGRTLLGAVLGFAVLGAGALVVSDDARWLRLGIVAALWAALVGAFAAARYRREAAAENDRSEELRKVYELELEREVAARREYELEVETDTRRRVDDEVRNEVRGELDGLRTELRTLRQNLEALLGGEVLVERVALRAESTRLRSLSDQSRAARSADRALPQGPSYPSYPSQTGQWRQDAMRAFASQLQDAEVIAQRPHPPANQPRPEPARTDRPQQGRPQPALAEPLWPEHSEPGPMDPPWPARSAPQPRVESADPTDVLPRYPAPAEPPRAGLAKPNRETSQPLDFRPLRRPEPQNADRTAAEQSQWSALSAQPTVLPSSQPLPPSRQMPQPPSPQRGEAPMVDPVNADPLTSTGWHQLDPRTPSSRESAGPLEAAATESHGNGNGTGGHRRRTGDEAAAGGYTGRRRRPDHEDAAARSVNDLLASHADDGQPRHRHRRGDG